MVIFWFHTVDGNQKSGVANQLLRLVVCLSHDFLTGFIHPTGGWKWGFLVAINSSVDG